MDLKIDRRSSLPVYAQIREQISWLIASDRLPLATRLPDIRRLARQLRISLHTVRRAYHALEDDGLLETKPSRGTTVRSTVPRQSVPGQTGLPSHTVGVLLPGLNPFYVELVGGFEQAARRLGFLLILCVTHDDPGATRTLARQLVSKNVDGLVAVATRHLPAAGPLRGLPLVHVDVPGMQRNSILFNLESTGRIAAQHLVWHGHRKIGLISAPLAWKNSRGPARGYRRALRQAGLPVNPKWIVEAPAYARAAGYQAGRQLCLLRQPPTAIFVSGDVLAFGAMQAIRDSGRRIPEDIAIVSKDNIEFSALCEPPLSSVSLPVFEAGAESMNMLHKLMRGGASQPNRLLPGTRLVIRQSCGCHPSA